MDGEAFRSRVTGQPPPSLPSLLHPTELCREQLAFPGLASIPPTPRAPAAALRLVADAGRWRWWRAYLQPLTLSATLRMEGGGGGPAWLRD